MEIEREVLDLKKRKGELIGKVTFRREEIHGFDGTVFEFWVLNGGDIHFCSTPLRKKKEKWKRRRFRYTN